MALAMQLGERAVVIGAGMGGLLAAGVLARYFTEVTVLDKDRLPSSAEVRMGAPQSAHSHALMVRGRRNVEQIFPGFLSEVIDNGAIVSRLGLEMRTFDSGGWFPERDLGLPSVTLTRPLLEGTVRKLLTRNPQVTIRDDVTVTGWREAGQQIEVALAGETAPLTADFVVDASGRSGNAPAMLEANGYGPVEEIVIGVGTGYASALFEIPPGQQDPTHSFAITHIPPSSHNAFLFAVEGNRWSCSLAGRFDEAPPKDPAGFMEFSRNLPDPCVYDRISKAKQVTPIRVYKPAYSRWRRYERLAEFPRRLAPLGDALAMVNPIFGQGMTLASTHAVTLWKALERCASGGGTFDTMVKDYLAEAAGFTQQVWSGLETVDFEFPKVTGERPANLAQRQAFAKAVRQLANEDAEVHRLVMSVSHLVEPGSVLQRADIMERVQAIMANG